MGEMTEKVCSFTEWRTPRKILDRVDAFYRACGFEGIELDPATTLDNPVGAGIVFTEAEDGLKQPWGPLATFVNPPYGKVLKKWCAKIGEEAAVGTSIVALLPGQRFEQLYYQEFVFNPRLTAMVAIRSRLAFIKPDGTVARGNPFGTFLMVYNGQEELAAQHFSQIGMVLIPKAIHQMVSQ